MESNLPEPEFVIFADLVRKLGRHPQVVHDLICKGRIVPAIFLTDSERHVGGVFRGGNFVGDIEGAAHLNCQDYYVGTDPDKDDFRENWPQCSRVMYCHRPTGNAIDGYSFRFLSESPDGCDTTEWFCLDNGKRIGSVEGESRFRFVWLPALEQYKGQYVPTQLPIEVEVVSPAPSGTFPAFDMRASPPPSPESSATPSAESSPTQTPPPAQGTMHHTKTTRRHALHAQIEDAKTRVKDKRDARSTWDELVKMAEEDVGPFRGFIDGKLKFIKPNGEADYYTMSKLRNRLRDRRPKTR